MKIDVSIIYMISLLSWTINADGNKSCDFCPVQNDVYLNCCTFRHVETSSLYVCASECMTSSACQSFNFNSVSNVCHLKTGSSENNDVDTRRGFIYSDVKHWNRSLTGPCFSVSCNASSRCRVLRNDQTQCVLDNTKLNHLPHPYQDMKQIVEFKSQKYLAHQDVHGPKVSSLHRPVETVVTCKADFTTCGPKTGSIIRDKADINQTCERFRWHNLSIPFLERLPCKGQAFQMIKIQATPTKTSRMIVSLERGKASLFHVGCRLEETLLVLNTYLFGSWQSEIRTRHPFPFKVNKHFVMEIRFTNGLYKVSVDGKFLAVLRERLPKAKPTEIKIQGAIRVTSLEIII